MTGKVLAGLANIMQGIGRVLSWIYWPALIASIVFCILWIRHAPSAGIAIGALGAAGIFVAIKGEKLSDRHRVIWAVITVVFLVTEVRAINHQDDEHAAQIQQILSTYQSEMIANQNHFDATISSLSSISGGVSVMAANQATTNAHLAAELEAAKNVSFLKVHALELAKRIGDFVFRRYGVTPQKPQPGELDKFFVETQAEWESQFQGEATDVTNQLKEKHVMDEWDRTCVAKLSVVSDTLLLRHLCARRIEEAALQIGRNKE